MNIILSMVSTEKKQELERWTAEGVGFCPHSLSYKPESLIQNMKKKTASSNPIHCHDCDIDTNLWFCLDCGEYHCGRKQWGPQAPPGIF